MSSWSGYFSGVKNGVYGYFTDAENVENLVKKATRATGAITGGSLGFIAGGPIGAVAGGVSGGVAADTLITKYDSRKHNEYRAYGYLTDVKKFSENPCLENGLNVGQRVVIDGALGCFGGQIIGPYAGSLINAYFIKQATMECGDLRFTLMENPNGSFPNLVIVTPLPVYLPAAINLFFRLQSKL